MAWNFRFYWMNFANLVPDVLEIFGGMWQGLALFWKMMYHLQKSSDFCISSRGCHFFENHISTWVFPKIGVGPPNHPFVHRVFHEIFTIHFGGKIPLFWEHPYTLEFVEDLSKTFLWLFTKSRCPGPGGAWNFGEMWSTCHHLLQCCSGSMCFQQPQKENQKSPPRSNNNNQKKKGE